MYFKIFILLNKMVGQKRTIHPKKEKGKKKTLVRTL